MKVKLPDQDNRECLISLTPAELECLTSELRHITHTSRIQPVLDEIARALFQPK